MMPPNNLQEAVTRYISLGLSLVEIPHGSKAPKTREWQKNTVSDLDRAKAVWSMPRNIGLDHAHSGTCCLDPDDMPHTHEAFEAIGLPLDDYLNADTPKIKGAKGIKPVFKMPKGVTLETKKLAWHYQEDGKRKARTIFELRGAGGQDVLPPSLHPDGIHYQWVDGYPNSYEDFLELPLELLNLWQRWEFYLPIMQSVSPYFKVPKMDRKIKGETSDIIQQFNASVDLVTLLEGYGYARK
jgi:hypothetical protein